ncbi:hypothetical protein O3W44_24375 [Pantoea sp. LMR881]|nr:hypothetical protein [Pantoea sp. LMR881]
MAYNCRGSDITVRHYTSSGDNDVSRKKMGLLAWRYSIFSFTSYGSGEFSKAVPVRRTP